MFLHNDKEAFTELVLAASQEMKIDPVIVEKDYFVSITLKKILERFEDIVFRGGTALSKCYEIIDRLSEDIDISVEGHMTDGRKKNLKNAIVDSITEVNLELFNLQETRSRRAYNKYIAKYESIYSDITTIKSEIIVETYLATQPFPTKRLPVGNIIYKSLEKIDRLDVARQFDLFPFETE